MWPFNRLSVFWKVFIWFWSSLVLLVLVAMVTWMLVKDNINYYAADERMLAITQKIARILESDMYEERKRRAIRGLLRSFEPPRRQDPSNEFKLFRPFYLVDETMRDWRGGPIPNAAVGLLSQTQVEGRVAVYQDFVYIAGPMVTQQGQRYRLVVSQYVGRFKGRVLLHIAQSFSVWPLLAFLSASGVMCFMLAWTITRPIRQLQFSAHQVASGQALKAVDHIGNRRDEFFELAQDFDAMAQKMLSTVNSQKQMLSDVSHELRSPLTRMQIALGLLEKSISENEQRHFQQLVNDCELMEQMIAQILKLASLDRGQIFESEELVEFFDLIEHLIQDVQYEADRHNITIEVDNQTGQLSLRLLGYYGLLKSAIENCLRNAVKYSPQQSTVALHIMQTQRNIKLLICDQGNGVKEEYLPRLFEPFFRTDEARTRELGGAGLGLAIARRAVMAHQGNITAQQRSDGKNGLCIVVELPLSRVRESS